MRLLLILLLAAAAQAQQVLVITPDEFRPSLKEWRAHREAQGYKITVKAPGADVKGFAYVLILGDVKQVPCTWEPGEIIKAYERDPRIATDNHLADTDKDGLPDLAVGRLPADDVAEARLLLRKVLEYEKNADFSTWRRRINLVAGVGGFGKLQDWALEQVATTVLSRGVPDAYDLHVTYCNPNSAFCPPPWTVAKTALERFNEGALIVAYLGHGSRMRLDSMRFQERRFRIFDDEHAYELKARHGAPIAVLVACSSGHIDGAPDCLAEIMLKQPRGPVAIIASSRVSMPYANGIFAKEILEAVFARDTVTLGDVLVRAKRRLIRPDEKDQMRKNIEQLATLFMPDAKKREQERREHLYLYNLLGDPTLRIALPAAATIKGEVFEGKIAVTGTSPLAGRARIELVAERTPNRPKRTGDTAEEFAKAYERANHWVLQRSEASVIAGAFTSEFKRPEKGSYVLRIYVSGEKGAAAGAAKLEVE